MYRKKGRNTSAVNNNEEQQAINAKAVHDPPVNKLAASVIQESNTDKDKKKKKNKKKVMYIFQGGVGYYEIFNYP